MKPVVVLLAGQTRSGSTILERLLGEVDGVAAAGEVQLLWERGFVSNQLCGCGVPFRECSFWRAVLPDMMAGGGREALRVHALHRQVVRWRRLPVLAWPRLRTPAFREHLDALAGIMEDVYRRICGISGCRVVVDSSKSAPHGLFLAGLPGIDLRVVHLVRDSRGVAFSWQRPKLRPEITGTPTYFDRHGPLWSAAWWSFANWGSERVARRAGGAVLVRYEDLVRWPRETLGRVLAGLGVETERFDFLDGRLATLGPAHTVSGNPVRFRTGPVEIREDDAWRRETGAFRSALIWALSWRRMSRYGYPLSRRAGPRGPEGEAVRG